MEGLLAKRCRDSFDSRDRARGEEYFSDSLVDLIEIGDKGVFAIAEGTFDYGVFLSFRCLHEDCLEVHCDCPRFSEAGICKHIWATIRMVDSKLDLNLSGKNNILIEAFDPDQFEVGESSLSTLKVSSKNPPKGSSGPTKAKVHRDVSKLKEPVKIAPTWKTKLASVSRFAELDNRLPSLPIERKVVQETRNWFAISLADQAKEDRFQIQLYESKTKKNGDWSIPIKVSPRRSELSSLHDPLTRRVLAMLDWETSNGYGYRSYGYDAHSTLRITPELCRETLQALCDSQRFVWTLDGGNSLSELNLIESDVEHAWQFIVRIEPSNAKEIVRVVPGLTRSRDSSSVEFCGIDKVVAVCDSGAVLFENSVGVVPTSDTGWVRGWQRVGAFEVPQKELETFLKEFVGECRHPNFEIDPCLGVPKVCEKPQGKMILNSIKYDHNYLKSEIFFKYGEASIPADATRKSFWSDERKGIGTRDFEAEEALLQHLNGFPISESHFRPGQFELKIHQKWFTDLVRTLLANSWEVIAHGKLHRNAGGVNIQVASGQDWFDLNAQIDFDGQRISLPVLLSAMRRGEKFVVLDDGSQGILPEKWLARLQGLTQVGEVQGEGVRFRRNQALLLEMLLAEQSDVSVDRNFSNWCNRLKKFAGVQPAKQPRGFQGELRSYQQEALGWFRFLNEFDFGGCLADDMGLGKTIQVLALLEGRRTRKLVKDEIRKPSIVIVPKSLVFNWIDEGSKFAPKLKILDYTGSDRSLLSEKFNESDLIVTTYATFRLDVEQLCKLRFDYAILDEAQAIKNPSAQATKAVRLIQADHRLAMTGTPIENHLGDLWSIFDFLNPGMLGGSTSSSFTLSVDEDNQRIEALSKALRPFILRRTKEQVLTELPEKTEQTLYCDLSPKQKKLYDELRNHYRISLAAKVKELGIQRSKIHVLEALLRLRQAACDPRLIDPKQTIIGAKLELLVEQLSDVVAEGHKVLIFSQFTSLLALVKNEIDAKRWKYEYLDGKTSNRAERVARFQEDPACSLFLISLKAGGLGLNLTAAEYVYILDPWWNPAVEAQAIDRAHRLGQIKPVIAYRMIARGTVEEKIVQLQKSKKQLADAVITADQSLLRKLSMDDLQVLFE
jgi:superfamily II DNA or RNA helicase